MDYLLPTYTIDPLLKHRADLLIVETNTVAGTKATAA